jgi:poly-gamma-glutamate synthesis protein (capsule biosynthesis protein)
MCALLTALVMLGGCASMPTFADSAPAKAEVMEISHTPAPSIGPTQKPTPKATASPSPSPVVTPVPAPVYATIGVLGDIMMMQSQVGGAWNEQKQAYDFTPSFRAMQGYFQSADLLCGNLETPIAGKEAGYTGPAPSTPPPIWGGTPPPRERQTFNAPDELASSLKLSGFDVITTANNHCLDRGADGAMHTAQVLRAAGLVQLGTYTSEEDRQTARVVNVKGIKVGLLAWTFSVNGNEGVLSSDERGYAVGRTGDKKRIQEDIRLCKEAGAQFLIAFVHWDTEFEQTPASSTRKMARYLLEQGVDAILGSHPHVVQPAEYVTVQRGEAEYTGLVAYSLGNCVSNMSPSPRDYGLYVQLTLVKQPDGIVRLYDAGSLPTYCCKHRVEGRTLHEVLPAEEDASVVATEYTVDTGALARAREHVLEICGDAVPPLQFQIGKSDARP